MLSTLEIGITLPETNSSHLKMDGWNTILSYWGGLFSGATLVSGRVSIQNICAKCDLNMHIKASKCIRKPLRAPSKQKTGERWKLTQPMDPEKKNELYFPY